MNTNEIITGAIFRGVLLGMKSDPWKNDATKFNHSLAIQTRKPDGFGGHTTEVKLLEFALEDFPMMQQLLDVSKGAIIEAPYNCILKTIKNFSFLDEKIPAKAHIRIIQAAQKPEQMKKAS